jgi:hypothetical protein
MTAVVVPSWGAGTSADPWQQFEKACGRTLYYSVAGDGSRQNTPVDLETYFGRPAEFRNPALPQGHFVSLEAPWDAGPTLAAGCWFSISGATNLRKPTCSRIAAAPIDTLAGSSAALASIAAAVRDKRLKIAPLRRGLIVFESLTGPALSAVMEREFWEVFEAPVVRQIRGFQGELLAAQCAARQGLHVLPENAYFEVERRAAGRLLVTSFRNLRYPVARLRTRLAGELDWSQCKCGLTAPLIASLRDWQPAVPGHRLTLAAAG